MEKEGKKDATVTQHAHRQILRAAQKGNWTEAQNILSELEDLEVENLLFTQHRSRDEAPLLTAAKHGRIHFVEQLIIFGAQLDEEKLLDGYHDSVVVAASRGDDDLLQVLSERKLLFQFSRLPAPVNNFINAVKNRNFEYAERLLNDENTGVVERWGQRLACLFIINGCPPSCLKALKDRVDLSDHDCNGYTSLMWAVLGRNVKCVNFLVCELNVTVNAFTKCDKWRLNDGAREGRTALMFAACLRKSQCLIEMLQLIGIDEVKHDDSCALNYAALLGNTESVRLLIKSGALIEDKLDPGVSIIDHVVQSGNAECVELVLGYLSSNYITYCLRNGFHNKHVRNTDVLKVLMKYLDDWSVLDFNCNTFLTSASDNGHLESVRLLLEWTRPDPSHLASSQIVFGDASIVGMVTDMQESLMYACRSGHQSVADLLLLYGANINFNSYDRHAKTALMYACENGHHQLVEFLVKRGADIDKADRIGKTAFMYACDKGHTTIMNLLVKYGADINKTDGCCKTVLMHACDKGCDAIVHLLVKKYHVNLNKADTHKRTVLMNACQRGNSEYVDLFINLGADIHARDIDQKTPLIYACEKGCDLIVKLLIESGAEVDVSDRGNKTALMYACHKGHDTITNLLITHRAKINALDCCNKTAIIYAYLEEHATNAEVLTKLKADVNAQSCDWNNIAVVNGTFQGTTNTPLIHACAKGNTRIKIMESLLNHGANVNERDRLGMTLLMMACEKGDNNVIDVLMKHGASVNKQDVSGRTALMHSCINNQFESVELLLKNHDVYADARDAFGKSALMLSCQYGLRAIVDTLIDSGMSSNSNKDKRVEAVSYARFTELEKIRFQMQNPGIDVNAFDKHEQTAMMYVIHGASKQSSAIRRLHKNSPVADIDACFERCLKKLLSVAADPDCVDVHGDTAFSLAMMQGNEKILKILIDSGKLMHGRSLKHVHRDAVPKATEWSTVPLNTLRTALNSRIFEWSWCHFEYFPQIAQEAMALGMSPGKITYHHLKLYPLSLAFHLKYLRAVQIFVDELYFFADDYTFLTTHDCSGTKRYGHHVFSKPLSLHDWSLLSVSKAISLAGPPALMPERVHHLPIPLKLKSKLIPPKFDFSSNYDIT